MYSRRNSSAQATFTWAQTTTAALPLLTVISSKASISQSNTDLREEHRSLPCFMGSQWTAPSLKYWNAIFYHQRTWGRRWVFQKPSLFHKKSAYKQIKPRQTLQVRAHWGTDACLLPILRANFFIRYKTFALLWRSSKHNQKKTECFCFNNLVFE